MKFLLLSIIWFPITIIFLFLSMSTLMNMSRFPKRNILGLSNSYTDLPLINETSNATYGKSSLPSQDARILVLKKFFSNYKSELYDEAEEIVYQSDIYGIDYALIPAIAMQESQGCKVIPPGSYNCWGLGIYGSKKIHFASFKDAIIAVAKTIKEAYIKRGLTNPTLLEDRWTPSSVGQWSYSVNFFIGKIRALEKNYTLP